VPAQFTIILTIMVDWALNRLVSQKQGIRAANILGRASCAMISVEEQDYSVQKYVQSNSRSRKCRAGRPSFLKAQCVIYIAAEHGSVDQLNLRVYF
jgi:hypothetical protein